MAPTSKKTSAGKPDGRLLSWLVLTAMVSLPAALFSAATEPSVGLLGALFLTSIVLELSVPRLPQVGFAGGGAVGYVAAATLPQIGPGWAMFMALVALGVRSLTRGHSEPRWRALEGLVDYASFSLGCLSALILKALWPAAPHWLVPLVVLEIYLPAQLKLAQKLVLAVPAEERPRWRKFRASVTPLVIASAFLGVATAYLGLGNPWPMLWAVPVVVALSSQTQVTIDDVERLDREQLAAELKSARETSERQQVQGRHLRKELITRLDEYLVLEELSSSLAGTTQIKECAEVVVEKLSQMVGCQSLVVFRAEEDGCFPVAFLSPFHEELAEARLLRVLEPLVEKAWKTSSNQQQSQDPRGERIFKGENVGRAFLIERFGVLYAGRRNGAFPDDQLRLLSVGAHQTALAMRSVAHLEEQNRSLELLKQANQRLEEWGRGLAQLVESAHHTSGSLDPDKLLDTLPSELSKLASYEALVILVAGPPERQLQVKRVLPETEFDELGVSELVEAVTEAERPLLFEDLESSRFQGIRPHHRSLLAVPLAAEGDQVGLLLLSHSEVGAFTQEHQDLVSLLAYQAGAALEAAWTHQVLQESKAQLFQSSKMAAVGQLAAGVAHELNTPLGSTIIAIEAADAFMEMKPEAAHAKLEVALRESLRARDIIHKMLYYARDARYGERSVNLTRVVEDTVALTRHQFSMDQIELNTDLASVPTVSCNENELQQVVQNLLINARDAVKLRPDEERRIELVTRAGDDTVELTVSDNGPGIREENLERVFDPFFTTKAVGHGTGLGLSVSRQIVENFGGRLWLESTSEKGTTFKLALKAHAEG